MKKIFVTVGLSVGLLAIGEIVNADEIVVVKQAHEEVLVLSTTYPNENLQGMIREKKTGKQTRVGYQWKCKTSGCGYESSWHLFYGSAAKYALAHHEKYGHTVTVFGV
ncbi:hypothetical protein SAMN02745116_00540 [Pilibacter termitis]|uniref:Uncharacterized protein n=1 Tax=Pilibacter termitis TaxID=263852 RepID=A0A1T4L4J8_9ENTE|nr:hypothetical protein [Pilibacter termitis]SJZ49652.1 hypothetical protein SAMN02745116_00540 [Pilibacter termitis]